MKDKVNIKTSRLYKKIQNQIFHLNDNLLIIKMNNNLILRKRTICQGHSMIDNNGGHKVTDWI